MILRGRTLYRHSNLEKIKENGAFRRSVQIYRDAVDFFISVIDREWDALPVFGTGNTGMKAVEAMTVTPASRTAVPYDFAKADKRFYKMLCYLRRAAVIEALDKVSSYRFNLFQPKISLSNIHGYCILTIGFSTQHFT